MRVGNRHPKGLGLGPLPFARARWMEKVHQLAKVYVAAPLRLACPISDEGIAIALRYAVPLAASSISSSRNSAAHLSHFGESCSCQCCGSF